MRRDLKKELRHLYAPAAHTVQRVDVPTLRFLKVDGQGDPNESSEYRQAVEALFSLSYALKFRAKKAPLEINYGVMPLEGLWWADDMSSFTSGDRSQWRWTMMIMQPDFIDGDLIEETRIAVAAKKNLPGLQRIRLESLTEGPAAQIMHIGPFATEGPTIEKVHRFIAESGHELSGKHHEIYLSDIRKANSEKWKTVIRQPFR
ncbi:MAG: GyrI-like domain-containing protein [Coriobacteriia bacterium]